MTVDILDETGEVSHGELEQHGRYTVCKVNGRLLLPGAYTVLSQTQVENIQRAMMRETGAGR